MAGGVVGPVAGAADEDASVGPITEGARPVAGAAGRNAGIAWPVASTAGLVAGAAGRDVSAGPITEDAEPLDGVADSVAQLSQTGQTFPLQVRTCGVTKSRMVSQTFVLCSFI